MKSKQQAPVSHAAINFTKNGENPDHLFAATENYAEALTRYANLSPNGIARLRESAEETGISVEQVAVALRVNESLIRRVMNT